MQGGRWLGGRTGIRHRPALWPGVRLGGCEGGEVGGGGKRARGGVGKERVEREGSAGFVGEGSCRWVALAGVVQWV